MSEMDFATQKRVKETYMSMSDSGLIDLLCAFKKDYQGARERDDAICMSFCEKRMEIIEHLLSTRGSK